MRYCGLVGKELSGIRIGPYIRIGKISYLLRLPTIKRMILSIIDDIFYAMRIVRMLRRWYLCVRRLRCSGCVNVVYIDCIWELEIVLYSRKILLITIQGESTLQGDVDEDGPKPVSMNNTKIEIQ